jgi:hypothetical protein
MEQRFAIHNNRLRAVGYDVAGMKIYRSQNVRQKQYGTRSKIVQSSVCH